MKMAIEPKKAQNGRPQGRRSEKANARVQLKQLVSSEYNEPPSQRNDHVSLFPEIRMSN